MYSQLYVFRAHGTIRTIHTNYAAAPKTTIHPQTQKTIRCNSTSNAPDDGRMYPETRRAENTSIKLPCCIKLAFHIISRGRCTIKQPSRPQRLCFHGSSQFDHSKCREPHAHQQSVTFQKTRILRCWFPYHIPSREVCRKTYHHVVRRGSHSSD